MTATKYKLNIFDVLGKLSKKNSAFYDNLSDEEQKALQPLVVMRWLSGTSSMRQVFFLNELVNHLIFELTDHKKLLVQMLSVCTDGNFTKYQWKKTLSKKGSSMPVSTGVIKEYFTYTTVQAKESMPMLTDDDIIDYADQLGRQPDDIKTIKKELKTRQ